MNRYPPLWHSVKYRRLYLFSICVCVSRFIVFHLSIVILLMSAFQGNAFHSAKDLIDIINLSAFNSNMFCKWSKELCGFISFFFYFQFCYFTSFFWIDGFSTLDLTKSEKAWLKTTMMILYPHSRKKRQVQKSYARLKHRNMSIFIALALIEEVE